MSYPKPRKYAIEDIETLPDFIRVEMIDGTWEIVKNYRKNEDI